MVIILYFIRNSRYFLISEKYISIENNRQSTTGMKMEDQRTVQ